MPICCGCRQACFCNCRRTCGTSDWKVKVASTAIAAVAGMACYAGYEAIKQKYDSEKGSQLNTSSAVSTTELPLEECSICRQKMKPRKHFHCGHNFHEECLSQCFTKSTCPVCKAKQVSDSEADWEFVGLAP